jgi:hypothetical protein
MRLAFVERLSGAPTPEAFACTALGLKAIQLYDAIRVAGFDPQVHAAAVAAALAGLDNLSDSPGISTALRAVLDALPFWSEYTIPNVGRGAVHHCLLQYGRALADESQWDLALDVYSTVAIDAEEEGDTSSSSVARFLAGFAARRTAQWELSTAQYERAHELAIEAGDFHLALRAKIGLANNSRARGNLAEADCELKRLLSRARSLCPEVLPRVVLARAGVANAAGRYEQAVVLARRAFELAHDDEELRYQALVDLANLFVDFGLYQVASQMLRLVAAHAREKSVRFQASLNLLCIAVDRKDKGAFDRLKKELSHSECSAQQRTQLRLHVAEGFRVFGQIDEARAEISRAASLAAAYSLFQLAHKIEEEAKTLDATPVQAELAMSALRRHRTRVPYRVSVAAEHMCSLVSDAEVSPVL